MVTFSDGVKQNKNDEITWLIVFDEQTNSIAGSGCLFRAAMVKMVRSEKVQHYYYTCT
jgi:hypothetical protein